MRLIPVRLWALAAVSGVLQVLSFPIAGPVPAWRSALCWFALAPLLWALLDRDKEGSQLTLRQAAALGYLNGFVWYLGNCYWIYQTMYLYGGLDKPVAAGILVLFCLYLGLYNLLFAVLVVAARSRLGRIGALLISPFAWVAVELARARITGFPWDLLGIAQVDNPVLTRLAPITGAYGLSFVIALVNALWLLRVPIRERRYARPVLTVVIVAGFVFYVSGLRRLQRTNLTEATAQATLVQENLEVGAEAKGPQPTTQQMLESFSWLSLHPGNRLFLGMPEAPKTPLVDFPPLQDASTNLIVWPESPAPFEERDPQFRTAISALARNAKAPIIVGNIGIERNTEDPRGYSLYNSASFITPQGEFAGRYDKIHLVPFGEYVPFQRLFFFAKNLLNEVGTFDAGRERTVFRTNGHRYGVFICYESVFGDEVRRFVENGAEVLINISNDGWYGDTSAPWQHLNMVRMRAIESHRWVLRATNTGVTAVIDPNGRVLAAAPRHLRTSIRVAFGYEHDLTFYAAHGDLFAYACAAITALVLLLSFRGRMPYTETV